RQVLDMKRAIRSPSRPLDDCDRLPLPIVLDVLTERAQFIWRHAREKLGGGMYRQAGAPAAALVGGRFCPKCHGEGSRLALGRQNSDTDRARVAARALTFQAAAVSVSRLGCVLGFQYFLLLMRMGFGSRPSRVQRSIVLVLTPCRSANARCVSSSFARFFRCGGASLMAMVVEISRLLGVISTGPDDDDTREQSRVQR